MCVYVYLYCVHSKLGVTIRLARVTDTHTLVQVYQSVIYSVLHFIAFFSLSIWYCLCIFFFTFTIHLMFYHQWFEFVCDNSVYAFTF